LTIVLLVEGATEIALKRKLKEFLDQRAQDLGRPRAALQIRKFKGLNREALGRQIKLELQSPAVKAVVGLIDVFPQFKHADAAAAKRFLMEAARNAGVTQGFYAHAAQYDVEAWVLPYWNDICLRVGIQQGSPGHNPEQVDGVKPPSYRLRELYQRAKHEYTKTLEMPAILEGKDLMIAANTCPELKGLLNTLLKLSDLPLLL
jgi:Domain of unknown function (DUF4276)